MNELYVPDPNYIGEISFQNGLITIQYSKVQGHPNWFRRFFYWALLGGVVKKYE